MKIVRYTCEQCGEEFDPEREAAFVVVVVRVEPPGQRPPQKSQREQFFEQALGISMQPKQPKEDLFEFCTSCASALLIALKQAKLRVKRGQKREME